MGPAAGVAMLVGIGMVLVGWLFFRRPGVPLWTAYAPVWRAGEYLTTPGVLLWLAAVPVLVAAFVLAVLASRT